MTVASDGRDFSDPLAKLIFEEEVPVERLQVEMGLAARLVQRLSRTSLVRLREIVPHADADVVAHLSGRPMLLVADAIESRDPLLIDLMPSLVARRSQIARAKQMANIFRPEQLARLATALEEDDESAEAGG